VRDLSLRAKLALVMGVLVAAMAAVFLLFFPARMNGVATKWSERLATGMASMLSTSVAPGVEFDDRVTVEEALRSLAKAPGALYGVVYRSDKTVLGGWHADQAPALEAMPSDEPMIRYSPRRLHVVTIVKGRGGSSGALAVGYSLAELEADKRTNLALAVVVTVVVFAAGLAFSLLVGTWFVRPISGLTLLTRRIVQTADLTQRPEPSSRDEVGQLSRTFGEMVDRQRSILISVKRLATGLSQVVAQVSQVTGTVAGGAATIAARVQDTTTSMQQALTSIKDIDGSIDNLHQSAEQASVSIVQMNAVNQAVKTNVETTSASVNETATAVEQMTAAVKEIARNIEELTAAVSETAASMSQIDASIRQVQGNANETAQVSEAVTSDAELAVDTVKKTMAGIDAIRQASQAGSDIIDRLGKNIAEIGNILSVIKDVADQTNLLALNAAIIAAQAGEHGRGFAVVADEIKQLAERTGASTSEIAALVERIVKESANATASMHKSLSSVGEGVRLGKATEEALEKIVNSAKQSTAMFRSIASATVEQARGSQQITIAVQRIADNIDKLNVASREQVSGAERIIQLTTRMRQLTGQVQRSTEEQTRGSQQIIRSTETIHNMVTQIRDAQHQQTGDSERALDAVKAIQGVAEGQTTSMRELEKTILALTKQAESLAVEISRFRV
jgi:methyl-accepting chemotaxis protein